MKIKSGQFKCSLQNSPKLFPMLLLVLTLTGCERSYDDCILNNMRGVTSDSAAAAIRHSCRAKFPDVPEKKSGQRELNGVEALALTGRAYTSGDRYEASLYNGNDGLTITQVRINVTTKIEGKVVSRVYATDVTIPPHTVKDFSFTILTGDTGADYSWGVEGATGY